MVQASRQENEKGVHNGIYIPHPHNHEECSTRRDKYNADWKEKQNDNKKRKYKANAANPPNKQAGGDLSLAKSCKSALATHVMLSDPEGNQFVDDVLNSKFNEYDDLE